MSGGPDLRLHRGLSAAAALVALMLLAAPPAGARDVAAPPAGTHGTHGTHSALGTDAESGVVYRPPVQALDGGATRILSGRSRGEADESLAISVIAPDHVGLTTRSQPTLYWYATGPIDGTVEITIQDEDATKPLVEARRELRGARGMMAVRLDEIGVVLTSDAEYRWSVAVVRDPAARSRDLVTSGAIRRVAPVAVDREVGALAGAGLWYDAIEVVSERLAGRPEDALARRQRASLLEQVGLGAAASADRAGRVR